LSCAKIEHGYRGKAEVARNKFKTRTLPAKKTWGKTKIGK